MDVLYVAGPASATSDTLAETAHARGEMQVVEFRTDADIVVGARAHAFGGPRFVSMLSARVDLMAIEPLDDFLVNLPDRFRRRDVELVPLSEASARSGRAFVKAPREKDFEAGVYSAWELPRADASDPLVLVSDVVSFTREYRLLVLDGVAVAGSRYLTAGRLDVCPLAVDLQRREVETFAEQLLAAVGDELPSAVTVDVGWAVDADRGDEGFAVVEANMAWFSNIYACDPDAALDVVLRSTGPTESFLPRDLAFARIRSEQLPRRAREPGPLSRTAGEPLRRPRGSSR